MKFINYFDNKQLSACKPNRSILKKNSSSAVVSITGQKTTGSNAATPEKKMVSGSSLGWGLAIGIPILVYFMLEKTGFDHPQVMYISITSITLVMWVGGLVPAFVAPLFALLLILLFGLVPFSTVLSGFSSDAFMLTFSILGIGSVVTSTGLTRRYTLGLIHLLPRHTTWYQAALFFTGLLFTPVVPSIPGRTAISAPVLGSMMMDANLDQKGRSFAMLYSGGLDGITFLSAVFMTGAPANLFIIGLLPLQEQQTFQFKHWLYAASVTGIIMLVSYFILSALFFRSYSQIRIDKLALKAAQAKSGPVTFCEWMVLICIVILALGIFTNSIHTIKIPVVVFSVLMILLYYDILGSA